MIDLKQYQIISIIGMAKNVGKTTTLNHMIKSCYGQKTIGITSIGRDGETRDLVTNTHKPMIYIEKGTILATARQCLLYSDFTKQLLKSTSIHTPMGEILILKALSDGYVDLAGPSFNKEMKEVVTWMSDYGVDLILIDGAISRKSIADMMISEAVILATGASYHSSLEKVVSDTKHQVELLSLPEVDEPLKGRCKTLLAEGYMYVMDSIGEKRICQTPIWDTNHLLQAFNKNSKYLLIKGALTDAIVKLVTDHRHLFNQLTIILMNGTKCLCNQKSMIRLKEANIGLHVLDQTTVLAVTYNPTSPTGYAFDERLFEQRLKEEIDLPIFNVMRDKDVDL